MVSNRFVSSRTPNKEEAAVKKVQRRGDVPLSLTKKRRMWTPAEKQAIVMETYQPDMSVSLVARKYGITPSRLYHWRKCSQEGKSCLCGHQQWLYPVLGAWIDGATRQWQNRPAKRTERCNN